MIPVPPPPPAPMEQRLVLKADQLHLEESVTAHITVVDEHNCRDAPNKSLLTGMQN